MQDTINPALNDSDFIITYHISKWIQNLLIIFGNSLVLISGIKYKKLKTSSYYYLYSLSCADLILVVANITYFILEAFHIDNQNWIILCHISTNLAVIQSALNIFHFTLMGLERCIYVVYPLYARRFLNKRFASLIITIIWLSTIISNAIISKLGYSCNDYLLKNYYCDWPIYFNHISYTVMAAVFVLSTLLIMILYSIIIYKIIIKPR